MNILYCTDENYVWLAGISIISLMENNKQYKVNVYIIADKISDTSKEQLEGLENSYNNLNIYIKDLPNLDELLGIKLNSGPYWSLSTYSRLFVGSILQDEIDKIIYLDCDIMVNDDLMPMWKSNMEDNWVGGCQDCISGLKWAANLKTDDVYINAGVLCMNLKKMRDDNVENKCIKYIKARNGKIFFNDQTVINDLMHKKIKIFPAKYNVITPILINGYKAMRLKNDYTNYYSEEEINDAIRHPILLHFVGGNYVGRPWIKGCIHPYAKKFLGYKAISLWKDKPLLRDNRSLFKKIYSNIIGFKDRHWILVMLVLIIKGNYRKN